jgi:hypothetical protein
MIVTELKVLSSGLNGSKEDYIIPAGARCIFQRVSMYGSDDNIIDVTFPDHEERGSVWSFNKKKVSRRFSRLK